MHLKNLLKCAAESEGHDAWCSVADAATVTGSTPAAAHQKPGCMQLRWWCWLQAGGNGRPAEYILWIMGMWRKWDEEAGKPAGYRHSKQDHGDFDRWLVSMLTNGTPT